MCPDTYVLNFMNATASLNCNQMLLEPLEVCTLFNTSGAV